MSSLAFSAILHEGERFPARRDSMPALPPRSGGVRHGGDGANPGGRTEMRRQGGAGGACVRRTREPGRRGATL
ncbi:hypothetical protein [Streptomyces sp. CA2R106]|uniref:hypothetical protein n=1 Tax=Streptomyces sp. CA2R106 TaxID=3120153 RepID=UPI00300BCF84